jgi:hypothetical protein
MFASVVLFAAEYQVGNHQGDAKAFDEEMRSIPENTTIYLTNAVYHTEGVWQINNRSDNPNLPGFRLKDGWRIVGQGVHETVIKLTNGRFSPMAADRPEVIFRAFPSR